MRPYGNTYGSGCKTKRILQSKLNSIDNYRAGAGTGAIKDRRRVVRTACGLVRQFVRRLDWYRERVEGIRGGRSSNRMHGLHKSNLLIFHVPKLNLGPNGHVNAGPQLRDARRN